MKLYAKVLLCVLTLSPLWSLVVVEGTFLPLIGIVNSLSAGSKNAAVDAAMDALLQRVEITLPLLFLLGLVSLGVLIYYIAHAANNRQMPDGSRPWWIAGLVLSFFIVPAQIGVTLVYFFVYIRPSGRQVVAGATG
ncbi:MAG: hypothetical protein M1337_07670 [Actinobacteria bacterium]|nr:hypothetical protein [Actinomycetota bacterium]